MANKTLQIGSVHELAISVCGLVHSSVTHCKLNQTGKMQFVPIPTLQLTEESINFITQCIKLKI